VRQVPKGVDPAFGYNLGEARLRWQAIADAGRQKVAGYAADIDAALAAEVKHAGPALRLRRDAGAHPFVGQLQGPTASSGSTSRIGTGERRHAVTA